MNKENNEIHFANFGKISYDMSLSVHMYFIKSIFKTSVSSLCLSFLNNNYKKYFVFK